MPPPHMRKKDSAACLPKPCGPNAWSAHCTSTPTNNGAPEGPACAADTATPTATPATTVTHPLTASSSTHGNGATSDSEVPSTQAESITAKLPSLPLRLKEAGPAAQAPLVCYASSDEAEAPTSSSDKANASATPKPEPKSTAAPPAAATAKKQSNQNDRANASNNSKAQNASARPPPNAPTAPRAQRTQGPDNNPAPSRRGRRSGRAQRKSQSPWIKNRDIPKPDPDRWAITWTEDKDYRSLSSLNSDNKQKPDVPPGIDPETGFMLTGYDGNWAPPPLDWESRPAFSSFQNVETVEKWLDRIDQDMLGKDTWISQDVIVTFDGTMYHFAPDLQNGELEQGDIAPRYWAPIVFAGLKRFTFLAPSTFWDMYVPHGAPKPQHDTDLEGVRPWWEKYAVSGRSVLQPLQHPEIKGIDPRETPYNTIQREADLGSLYHVENRKRAELAKIEAKEERRRKKEEKMRKWSESHTAVTYEKIKTGAVLYLRLAFDEDMARIAEIYNHYVSATISVPETEKWTESDMLRHCEDIENKKLPFIVACEEGGQVKGKRNRAPITLPDKIVGFAYADDHHDSRGTHRFTCDVEVYTAPDHYMKGVGKCLLDKMIGMLDPDYLERGGYRVDSTDLDLGALRVISTVIITVPYENKERLEWKSRCLTEWLGFEEIGDVKDTGIKLGQSVNTATFQRKTGSTIDPANPLTRSAYFTES